MSSSDVSKMWKFNEPSDERSLYQLLVRAYSSVVQGIHIPTNVKFSKLYPAIENTLYLCIKDKINNEKSYRLHSCFY